jgi:hypothetical protein
VFRAYVNLLSVEYLKIFTHVLRDEQFLVKQAELSSMNSYHRKTFFSEGCDLTRGPGT